MKFTSIYFFFSKHSNLLVLAISFLTLVTFFLTLSPLDTLGKSKLWSYDKLGHMMLFGSWTYILGLYHHIKRPAVTNLWGIFLVGVAFGLLIELLQYLLPLNRYAEFGDFFFDILGCVIAIGILKKTIPDS